MKRMTGVGSAVILWMVIAAVVAAAPDKEKPAPGEARTLHPLPAGHHPEGITLDARGTIYLGDRRRAGDRWVSEVVAIAPDGSVTRLAVLAELETEDPAGTGVLGLAADASGDVYAALVTDDPAKHGVWRIDRDSREQTRLAGSEQLVFPNALTFDPRGNLYVTDSVAGAIWRFPAHGGPGERWAQDGLLQPAPDDPFGFPAPGANGIAHYPPATLYVANTEKGLVVRVPIDLGNGAAGQPTVVASNPALLTIDGLAVDARGTIHAVIPGHAVLGISPLVLVDPATGRTTSPLRSGTEDAFDTPLSIAFGRGARDSTTVYAANGDLPGLLPAGHNAGIVEANVGPPGLTQP